jgi:hypothetical protein
MYPEAPPSGVGGLAGRAVLPALVFTFGLAAFAVPYALFLKQNTGSFVNPKAMITQLHSALLEASAADPYAFEKYYYDLEDVLADPVSLSQVPPELLAYRTPLAQRYVGNLMTEAGLWLTSASLMTLVWIIPAAIGALTMPRGRSLFLALLFAPLGAIPASVVDPRYFLPALPAAMIFAGFGWERVMRRLKADDGRPPTPGAHLRGRPADRRVWGLKIEVWSWAPVLLAATFVLFAGFDFAAPFWLSRPTEYRKAGLALRGQLPAGAHVLARKRQAPFYAGGTWEWLPFAELTGVVDYAKSHQADYLLLDRRTVVPLRPQLVDLLDPANAPAGLRPIYYDEAGGVVVYFIER